jgi:hypothetical protein
MSPRGATGSEVPGDLDAEKGRANEQAREVAIKANAAMITWLLLATFGRSCPCLDNIFCLDSVPIVLAGNIINYDQNYPVCYDNFTHIREIMQKLKTPSDMEMPEVRPGKTKRAPFSYIIYA